MLVLNGPIPVFCFPGLPYLSIVLCIFPPWPLLALGTVYVYVYSSVFSLPGLPYLCIFLCILPPWPPLPLYIPLYSPRPLLSLCTVYVHCTGICIKYIPLYFPSLSSLISLYSICIFLCILASIISDLYCIPEAGGIVLPNDGEGQFFSNLMHFLP